jgi:hypothetical protein
VRLARALKGIRVRVAVPAGGARVTATLAARRVGRIARVTRRRVPAGLLRLRMAPTRAAARRLRRAGALTATLRVSVTLPGQPATSETVRIRVRR